MKDAPWTSDFVAGQRLLHYTIKRQLGRGGMGEVFLAHDEKLDRLVALKVFPREFALDAERLRRFEVEARALAALNHPNIVSVYAVEEWEGVRVLVMEFVEGQTLRDRLGKTGMSLSEFFALALPLTSAVAAAHTRGVTHRDLKPENVMLTSSGSVKVLDFGLAKTRSQDSSSENLTTTPGALQTADGVLLGTAPYMSPEQAAGEPTDHRTDLFSLGVLFFEALTGKRPFQGPSLSRLVSSILRDTPPPVTAVRPDVPAALADVVSQSLEKLPEARPASAAELHRTLSDLAHEIEVERALDTPLSRGRLRRSSDARPRLEPQELSSRLRVTGLLAGLFVVNWIETSLETRWVPPTSGDGWVGYEVARAFQWFERGLSFERHDLTNAVAVHVGSIAYFFCPILMFTATMVVLWRHRTAEPLWTFAISIAISYAACLLFYLALPIPERWAYPDSQAILLSDLWSARLIETLRPISGLDNCFPSFHVAGTFDVVLVWFWYRLRYRWTMAFLGAAVALSTFLLGIHWLPDIAAGLALAVVSVRIAVRRSAAADFGTVRGNKIRGQSPFFTPQRGA
jgi:serine/threonine protein kinase/membrane-associated phospholipid phosphatase